MLSLLGWNPGTTQEIFSMDELIHSFSLDRVGKAGAKFDFDKTKWFNQQYLRAKNKEDLADELQIILKENNIFNEVIGTVQKDNLEIIDELKNLQKILKTRITISLILLIKEYLSSLLIFFLTQ